MPSDVDDEMDQLLDEAVQRIATSRRTFTEKEALQTVWEAGYEIPIHADQRFVMVHEGDGRQPGHWRLASQMVANTQLLNGLLSGEWDGRNLDEKLAALDAEGQKHAIFYPLDARLSMTCQGILEPAEHERAVKLPRKMKMQLDALAPRLLAAWSEAGAEPWTIRMVTEKLHQLGWSESEMHNDWLYVRAWLLGRLEVRRVGQDSWIPADQIPEEVQRTRFRVHPLQIGEATTRPETFPGETVPRKETAFGAAPKHAHSDEESQVVLRGEVIVSQARWTVHLRTSHLLEGFLPIPAAARAVYPPLAPGEEQETLMRGMWHEDGTRFWLWLNRMKNYLYGPELAERLMWLEAGTILRIEWAADGIVIRKGELDEAIQDEEARLVDLEALAAVRGGLGENYRRSLQQILAEAPEGLSFAEVVLALRKRQQHTVHRGTIHAILYSGGFIQKDRRWFAAPDAKAGARHLRAALVETLLSPEEELLTPPFSSIERVHMRVNAIHTRLTEIVTILRKTL